MGMGSALNFGFGLKLYYCFTKPLEYITHMQAGSFQQKLKHHELKLTHVFKKNSIKCAPQVK